MALSRNVRRALAHGGNATLVTVLVVVLVGVLYGIADRNRVRIDVSESGANQLQKDTLKKLGGLDEEGELVQVTAFTFQDGKKDTYFKNRAMRDLLLELDYQSSAVETDWVDFDKERLTAENLGVREYGHMVIKRGDERVDVKARELFRNVGKGADRRLEFLGEASFNRAASQLLSKRRRTVYMLRGHGEKDPEEPGPDGLSELVDLLDNENYELEVWDPYRDRDAAGIPIVPVDASGLLVAAPKAPLTQGVDDALVAYVAGGGALMVLLDPGTPLPTVLERLDVTVPEGIVADVQFIAPFKGRPVVQYARHSTVDELRDEHMLTVLDHIAGVRLPDEPPEWMRAKEVLKTSRDGWIDRGGQLEVGGGGVYEPDIDLAGPVTFAWALELQPGGESIVNAGKRVSRVLVIGDSDFATNDLLAEGPGNATFAVNAFRWLVWDDARISLIGSPTSVRRLALTEEDNNRILWMVLGLFPMLTLLVGAGVWASRRGR
ncbi:MAG TPA: DUF4350 domain-containing protein [Myxococcota bacterium]|nr:DUF4350 domain-containing protein [Myxococcota bacterium]